MSLRVKRSCVCSVGSSGVTQDLTHKLAKHFYEVQNPALSNRPYSLAVQDFTESAILAYECGYSEASLREQITTSQKSDENSLTIDCEDCLLCISIVWLTLMQSPSSVKRWASGAAVSDETLQSWKGFVAMIVNGYFEKRMAWFPIDRLQLELSAVNGRTDSPDIVAERARLVYTTLEKIYPQFPSM